MCTVAGFGSSGLPIELPSVWGTHAEAEILLMTHPGKCRVKDTITNYSISQ